MQIGVISLFPEMFSALDSSITGRALQQQLIELQQYNPRDYTIDKHKAVDDKPYGGGPGMLMMVQPLRAAISAAKQAMPQAQRIYLSPQGEKLTQAKVAELVKQPQLILVCGRYEGIDERVIQHDIDVELSLGDFVLSGGELAAMALIDAITRLLPGALGDVASSEQDSFSNGLLDHPHYTRPEQIDGQAVPKVLLSGDHKAIARWRREQALGKTWRARPDLLATDQLSEEDKKLLFEFQQQS